VPTGWCVWVADAPAAVLHCTRPGMQETVSTGGLHSIPHGDAHRLLQGNEARSLSSVPCPHPKQRCAATAQQLRLRLPSPADWRVDSHSTQTPGVRSTQTPALCLPETMLLRPSLLDLRAGAAPVLDAHVQQQHKSPGAACAMMTTPHPAAQDAVSAPAARASSSRSDSGEPHGNESSTSAPGWQQHAETVSGSCSPRSAPGDAVPQQRLQAQHDQQQHPEQEVQQPSSSSSGSKIPPRPASGKAEAHAGTLSAENRHLRMAVAEAQAERDEAVAQAHGLRHEVEELQHQVDSTCLKLFAGYASLDANAVHHDAASIFSVHIATVYIAVLWALSGRCRASRCMMPRCRWSSCSGKQWMQRACKTASGLQSRKLAPCECRCRNCSGKQTRCHTSVTKHDMVVVTYSGHKLLLCSYVLTPTCVS
jgi:hypothetical protein